MDKTTKDFEEAKNRLGVVDIKITPSPHNKTQNPNDCIEHATLMMDKLCEFIKNGKAEGVREIIIED